MLYRRFGRTEIKMPLLSCGGMRYMHKWQDVPLEEVPPENQANIEATVRRALELGINHFETSRAYGSSERQLGLVLPGLPRHRLIVQTKIQPLRDPEEFRERFLDSLARLQLEYVDLVAIHGINTFEQLWWSIRPGGCLAVLRELVADGKARHVGFSTHGPTEVILAAIEHSGDGGFDYVNLHWYYIFQQNWPAIEAAARRDMGVFIISPTDKGGMLQRPSPKLTGLCKPLHPIVFNCLFCLSRPQVHTLSVGAAVPGDFDLQVSSLRHLERAGDQIAPIEARLREALVAAVGQDAADRFGEGLPPWHKCPGYLNIPAILWLRSLALAYDMTEFAKMRYKLLSTGTHWLPGMNAAAIDDLDLETALASSPLKEKIPTWLREAHAMLYEPPDDKKAEEG